MAQLRGFHGRNDIIDQSCSSCHKEHFGEEFDAIRFDTLEFDHSITQFTLTGKHEEISCTSCHGKPEFITDTTVNNYKQRFELAHLKDSYLGTGSSCKTCHSNDNVHGDQFLDQSCNNCHTTSTWEDAELFDHNSARFKLTGNHIDVSCNQCHSDVAFDDTTLTRYTNIAFESCADCHEDIHENRLSSTCTTCHSTSGWHAFDESFPENTFPHIETGYALTGAHNSLECQSCHSPQKNQFIQNSWQAGTASYTYPEPRNEQCLDCHVDYHEGVFTESGSTVDCESCHKTEQWYPSTFGLSDHNTKASFQLAGAHIATPCFSCHYPSQKTHASSESWKNHQTEKPDFQFDDQSCISCHQSDNPHDDSSAVSSLADISNCESCHSVNSWNSSITFNHEAETGYALTGKHAGINCRSCHDVNQESDQLVFNSTSTDCISCHVSDSPHHNQFKESTIGASCENCHTTSSFTLSEFDHNRTSFTLEGAHIEVRCADCHVQEEAPDGTLFTRFHPLSTECESCHGT
jgi:nitrate/TMAO reductase-like tetraheme cytochrome c subunit